jgi:tripartite-type tricarboxylate transporter receptor subunit TctC
MTTRFHPMSFSLRRRVCGLGVALTLLSALGASAVAADGFPAKPIKLIVPFPAGSASDAAARILAQAFAEQFAEPVNVENKAGANGIVGAEAVKSAPADGYTLLVTTSTTQAANVSLYRKLSYDPVADFTPIGKIGVTGFILLVRPELPVDTIGQFIAYAKANPGKLAYGHGSSGSLVSAALFARGSGIDVQPVSYKGIPPALTDLIGGQLQFAFADIGNAVAQISSNRLKGLGVTAARRSSRAPSIPTIAEAGLPGFELTAWFALVGPAKIAPEVQAKLSAALAQALAKPDVAERIAAVGIDVEPSDGRGLAALIAAEIKNWARYVAEAGIAAE